MIFRLLPLTLLTTCLSAQVIPSGRNLELSQAARNPYDLARFIDSHPGFDWDVMWKALGVKPLPIGASGNFGEMRPCSTELITVLDPDQIILVIQDDITPGDAYLRFLQEKSGTWRFAGAHPAFIHNHPRRHEVDRSAGKPYLRVSSQGVRGSNLDSEIEDWFDLTEPGFEPVFSFPVRSSEDRMGGGVSRNTIGYLTSHGDAIDVILEVDFSTPYRARDLGLVEYNAVYRRAKGAKKFSLQEAYSDLAAQTKMPLPEFEALADPVSGIPNEDLIRYTIPELRKLASGRGGPEKVWLRFVLTLVTSTPEVRELKALLAVRPKSR